MSRRLRASLLTVLLLVPAGVWAHAYPTSVEPSGDAVLERSPVRIVVTMSEPVELRFSRFAVVAMADPPQDPASLRTAARDLAASVLEGRSEAPRADEGVVTTEARSDRIELALRPDLEAGTYVVLWRVLSIDGHVTQDASWFHVLPPAGP
jgi:hypothetical protein